MPRKQKMKAEQIGSRVKIDAQTRNGNRKIELDIPEGEDGILLLVSSDATLTPDDFKNITAGGKPLTLGHIHRLSTDAASERADFEYELSEGRLLDDFQLYVELPKAVAEGPVDPLYGLPTEDAEGNGTAQTWIDWKAHRYSLDGNTVLVSLSRRLSAKAWTSAGVADAECQLHRTRFTDSELLITAEYEDLIKTDKYTKPFTEV